MKARELFDSFHEATDTLSNQVRYVNYGLIAVVWILAGQAVTGMTIGGNGIVLFFILLSLTLDIFQYIWKSVTVWLFARRVEKKEEQSGIVSDGHKFPLYISRGTWLFFILKILSCLIACVLMVVCLIRY